ncbi:YigZ family protein [Natranaerobius thermophilus]|uniref:YigZ family protein n=1 Tax=Natranaerobius thermophilus TaxID=375929 RepID=UPI000325E860
MIKLVTSYNTVKSNSEVELYIKKSRFISYVAPVDSEEKAQEFVNTIKEQHSDATHNVYAYRVGLKSDIKRQSDDGEPSGTAGKPVLDVIENQNLKNLAIVVTRYFGGIKLGAGGLVRAYSNSAKEGVEQAGIVTRSLHSELKIEVDYSQLGKIQNEIGERTNWLLRNTEFMEKVSLMVAVPENQVQEFTNFVENMTAGQGRIWETKQLYL